MKTEEIRKILSESYEPKHLNQLELKVLTPNLRRKSISLTGLSAIHSYFSNQIEGWGKHESIPSELRSSKMYFANGIKRIEDFVLDNIKNLKDEIDDNWDSLNRRLNGSIVYTVEAPRTIFLLKVYKEQPKLFKGSFSHFDKSQINMNLHDNFLGKMYAYNFDIDDVKGIVDESTIINSEIDTVRERFKELLVETETQVVDHLSNVNLEFKNYIGSSDSLVKEKKRLFDAWYLGDGENVGAVNKIENLAKIYEELLSLQKPATYWRERAKTLKEEGWTAIRWLIGLVLFACGTLYALLWITPEGMLLSFISGNPSAIKWSIIYITFISFLTYGVRALNKVAFSSFHLARDAEEKEQLTYLYLSLRENGAVEAEDRNLILQSLFSRADSGLLKDESGPKMPTNISPNMFSK